MNTLNFNLFGSTALVLASALSASACSGDVKVNCDSTLSLVGPTANKGQSNYTLTGCQPTITYYDHVDDAGTPSGGVSVDVNDIINPVCSAKLLFANKNRITAFSDTQSVCDRLNEGKDGEIALSVVTGAQILLGESGKSPVFVGDSSVVFSYEPGEPTHKNLNLKILKVLNP